MRDPPGLAPVSEGAFFRSDDPGAGLDDNATATRIRSAEPPCLIEMPAQGEFEHFDDTLLCVVLRALSAWPA